MKVFGRQPVSINQVLLILPLNISPLHPWPLPYSDTHRLSPGHYLLPNRRHSAARVDVHRSHLMTLLTCSNPLPGQRGSQRASEGQSRLWGYQPWDSIALGKRGNFSTGYLASHPSTGAGGDFPSHYEHVWMPRLHPMTRGWGGGYIYLDRGRMVCQTGQ